MPMIKTLIVIAALLAALPAAAQSSRSGRGEIYMGPVFTDGKSYSFEGGTTARTDTGFGFNFGYAYNFNSHVQAGIDLVWGEADYRATVAPGPGNPNTARSISGTLETGTVRFFGSYHLFTGPFTPYVTGGLGWSYVDTNIPAGLPENICWAYPWYGYYCATYVPTASTTKFSYNAGAGLRYDAGRGVFRLLVNSQWMDFGGSYGSANVIQYRIDFGTKF
jgi:opacity protein-like surface antigen